VCYLVNNDRSDPCYVTFGIGLSLSVGFVAFVMFLPIVEYCDPITPPISEPLAISSGPILPLGRLSSSPSTPSKILGIRTMP